MADEGDFQTQRRASPMSGNPIRFYEFDPENTGVEFGARQASIESARMLDEEGRRLDMIEGGEIVVLRVSVKLHAALDDLIVGFYVKDRLGQRLFGDNTYLACMRGEVAGVPGDCLHADFRFRMPILPQSAYTVDVAVASGTQDEHTQQHWIYDALEFRALDSSMRYGLIGIPMLDIRVTRERAS